ncbi:hypothetical protein B0H19DRAFT_946280, partial [Mycena capillaripes]
HRAPLVAAALCAVQVTADLVAWSGNACNGAEGVNIICDGTCFDFTGRHSFEVSTNEFLN